ncbi:MAG: selenide, water dikinase SelD [Halioglobus sp.]|nr:selenide, water dikinase SelD [Halioglobus sp.]
MLQQPELRRDLVLVGGGHSHALALRMLAMAPLQGLRLTLVSPASHTPYSGMLPGLIAGHYTFEQTHIDLARLCQWAGARFIAAEVTALDPGARRLTLAGRPPLTYDLVSLDIGSQPQLDDVPGAREHAIPVKPVAGLWARWRQLEHSLHGAGRGGARVGIVGGGAGGVELALAMAHRLAPERPFLDLWCGGPHILPGYNGRARRAALSALQRYGVTVHVDARVTAVATDTLTLADGSRYPFDLLFWCTAAAPAPWIADSGLPTDERGFLAVTDALQSTADERVFGAGDIATQLAHPRPKAGVFAVRQAPVLAHNLRAYLLGRPLRAHRPQRRFLSLLSLGERRATADKGPFSVTGAWVWRWKDRIDRKFMDRFSNLPERMAGAAGARLPELPRQPPMACGGCGAKVGADSLAAALAVLREAYPAHCDAAAGDAVAVPADGAAPVMQSLDILRQIVSDPWQMGRIAANHALSDLYACGAKPVSALAAITLPHAGADIQERDLRQLLDGALAQFADADCVLTGGHSMQGAELAVGFAVNGVPMDPAGRLLGKCGATPGDRLVLSKPLGTGVLFAAHMQLAADGRDIESAVEGMLQSNRAAAELALEFGASACTDITGFGLLGHLLEMLGSELSARLELSRLPLLEGAAAQLRAGIASSMYPANTASGQRDLHIAAGADEDLSRILFDPQTSGGLLIAVPGERADALCDALASRGYSGASIVGEVTARSGANAARVELV